MPVRVTGRQSTSASISHSRAARTFLVHKLRSCVKMGDEALAGQTRGHGGGVLCDSLLQHFCSCSGHQVSFGNIIYM
ncbi:hypothetical protein CLOM_g1300 [Closterium sp. NIES-68]|nr:hypothetical protein CLOM_g1300 [Closterium sp. NIES-68]